MEDNDKLNRILLAITGGFALLSILLLPKQVTLGIGSSQNIVPKAAGVVIPAGISLVGLGIRKYSGGLYQVKGFLTVLLGYVAAILLILFNL